MSNRPYGQKQARRQARTVKAVGCIQSRNLTKFVFLPDPK